MTAFNGGKSQAGLNYMQGGGYWPFLNHLKAVQFPSWADNTGNDPMTPDMFDTDGWPFASALMTARTGLKYDGMTLPTQTERVGNYIDLWTGNGTIGVFGTPCSLKINSVSAANPCIVVLNSNNDINTADGQTGQIAKFKLNQEIVIEAVGGADGGFINGQQRITAISPDGLTLTLNLNTTGKTFSVTSAKATHSMVSTNGYGRCVYFDTSNGQNVHSFTIRVIGSPKITGCALVHYDDEATLLAGGIFGDQFMRRMRQANFGVVRIMNCIGGTDTGGTLVAKWRDADKPTTYFSYQAAQAKTEYLAGTLGGNWKTSGSGGNYTIAAPPTWGTQAGGTKPANGQIVHVVFHASSSTRNTNTTDDGSNSVNWVAHGLAADSIVWFTEGSSGGSNTQPFIGDFTTGYTGSYPHPYYVLATGLTADKFKVSTSPGGSVATLSAMSGVNCRALPTLKVGSTDAIYIHDTGGGSLSGVITDSNYPYGVGMNALATLVYDGDLNVWCKSGGFGGVGRIDNGAPTAIWIEFANILGCQIWWTTHKNALLASDRDLVTGLATYCRDNAPSWFIPRFEGPNEHFAQKHQEYCGMVAQVYSATHGTTWGNDDVYGKMMSLMGQDVAAVYGTSGTVFTQQKYRIEAGVQTAIFTYGPNTSLDPVLACTRYVTDQGGSAAKNWVTHVCCANYTAPSIYGRPKEIELAWKYWVTHGGSTGAYPSGQLLTDATEYQSYMMNDIASIITSFNTTTHIIQCSAPHGLSYVGQPIVFATNTALFPAGFAGDRYYVFGIPDSTHFTICYCSNANWDPFDPRSPGPTQVTFSGSSTPPALFSCVPHGYGNTSAFKVLATNVIAWARGHNAGIGLDFYEGGPSPDYGTQADSLFGGYIYAEITAGTRAASCHLTISILNIGSGFYRHPQDQYVGNYTPIQVGMRIRPQGASGLTGGWAAIDGVDLVVTAASLTDITVSLDTSGVGFTTTLGAALATAGLSFLNAQIYDASGNSLARMLNNLRWAMKFSSTMQADLITHYNQLRAIDSGCSPAMYFLSSLPVGFQTQGSTHDPYPSATVWAVLEDVYQAPDPPQWLAAIAFNQVAQFFINLRLRLHA